MIFFSLSNLYLLRKFYTMYMVAGVLCWRADSTNNNSFLAHFVCGLPSLQFKAPASVRLNAGLSSKPPSIFRTHGMIITY